jgi:GrpB-like predicted nucleotidyltransferase (UPF0157 family)
MLYQNLINRYHSASKRKRKIGKALIVVVLGHNIMVRRIEVVSYDPYWKEKFNLEARLIKTIFDKEILAIHHIGSTAIPKISAKPIIDILFEVHNIDVIDDYDTKMIEQVYLPKGESGIPNRRLFIKGSEEFRSFV